jgi:hypothetical protein
MKCSKLSKSSLKLQILKSKSDSRILKIWIWDAFLIYFQGKI